MEQGFLHVMITMLNFTVKKLEIILMFSEKKKEPKRFKVSPKLKGDSRLENETYEDYKIRRKEERMLLEQYLKGTIYEK
jgi:hypothetical protein